MSKEVDKVERGIDTNPRHQKEVRFKMVSMLGLTESRIPLKLVLGYVRIIALSISSHEQTQ